jgi:uncharacterized repeat protein (TIGR01451 family)
MLPLLDTVNESILVTPTSGDTNTSNNVFVHEDTVKGSYDPNFIEVSPRNCFMNDTQFQYIINFENTGNDTAYNIHVMDTLSDNLDVKSLSILTASAPMDIYVFKYGGHNVVKFDFPNINLLDSSHHGLCDGAVFFTIKNKPGMASGATISNEAGIYFDDNPVVMTNKVVNTKGCVTSVPVIASKQSIELYPNPTHDAITITAPDKITDVVITNIVGQVVYRESTTPYPLLKTGGDVLRVNVANLPAGTYIVKVNGSEVRKFVKE